MIYIYIYPINILNFSYPGDIVHDQKSIPTCHRNVKRWPKGHRDDLLNVGAPRQSERENDPDTICAAQFAGRESDDISLAAWQKEKNTKEIRNGTVAE